MFLRRALLGGLPHGVACYARRTMASEARRIKVYTKTGDKGTSQLFTGERREKSDAVFHALGDTDELGSAVGVAREHARRSATSSGDAALGALDGRLVTIQSRLMDVGSAVATPRSSASAAKMKRAAFGDSHAADLEAWIDEMDAELPPLTSFILAGGGLTAAHLHHARAVCRRAERRVQELVALEETDREVGMYMNRLSDFFFVAARLAALREGHEETIYKKVKE